MFYCFTERNICQSVLPCLEQHWVLPLCFRLPEVLVPASRWPPSCWPTHETSSGTRSAPDTERRRDPASSTIDWSTSKPDQVVCTKFELPVFALDLRPDFEGSSSSSGRDWWDLPTLFWAFDRWFDFLRRSLEASLRGSWDLRGWARRRSGQVCARSGARWSWMPRPAIDSIDIFTIVNTVEAA